MMIYPAVRHPTDVELLYWNAQDLFDHVARHLLSQRRAAIDGEMHCRYRYAGLACAIGCLIPDHVYRPVFEGQTVITVSRMADQAGAAPFARVLCRHMGLCIALQRIHDGASVARWPGLLTALAEMSGMSAHVLPPVVPDVGLLEVIVRGPDASHANEAVRAYLHQCEMAALRRARQAARIGLEAATL